MVSCHILHDDEFSSNHYRVYIFVKQCSKPFINNCHNLAAVYYNYKNAKTYKMSEKAQLSKRAGCDIKDGSGQEIDVNRKVVNDIVQCYNRHGNSYLICETLNPRFDGLLLFVFVNPKSHLG